MLEKYLTSVQFIKDRVVANLVAARTAGKLEINEEELRRIIELVKSSVEQSAMDSASNFE